MASSTSAASKPTGRLTFGINGERFSLRAADVDPTVTLKQFLTQRTGFKGPKLGCGEGGCGACVVDIARPTAATAAATTAAAAVAHSSVNSCLCPLATLDGASVTTTEGLGGSKGARTRQGCCGGRTGSLAGSSGGGGGGGACGGGGGGGVGATEPLPAGADTFHPVQRAFADFNASQCGFCTPGMVMATYAALRRARDAAGGDDAARPTAAQLEGAFDGNICRCTGYRPILDAAKSFAADAACNANANTMCDADVAADMRGPGAQPAPAAPGVALPFFPEYPPPAPGTAPGAAALYRGSGRTWHRPASLDAALALLQAASAGGGGGGGARFVVGATSAGIYKEHAHPDWHPPTFIDLSGAGCAAELSVLGEETESESAEHGGSAALVAGGSVTLAQLQLALLAAAAARYGGGAAAALPADDVYVVIAAHIGRIANHHVRNAGSIAGNLVMARVKGFESDLATCLLAAGATVTLRSTLRSAAAGARDVPLEAFLFASDGSGFDPAADLLVRVRIPPSSPCSAQTKPNAGSGSRTFFASHKVGVRPENAHAYVNAACRVELSADGATVRAATVVFGGVGEAGRAFGGHHARATAVEELLTGAALAQLPALLPRLLEAVAGGVGAAVPDSSDRAEYRRRLVSSLTFKMVCALAAASEASPDIDASAAALHLQSFRPTTRGTQSFKTDQSNAPVAKAVPKLGAELQASGEAMFTGDVPLAPGTVFGAMVLVRRRPGARLARGAAALAGVRATVAGWQAAEQAAQEADEAADDEAAAAAAGGAAAASAASAAALLRTPTGVVGVLGAEDLPNSAANNCDAVGAESEPVFAAPGARTMYWGQPAALVVADTEAHALAAARALSALLAFEQGEEQEEEKGVSAGDGDSPEQQQEKEDKEDKEDKEVPVLLRDAAKLGKEGWLPALGWMPHEFKRGDAEAALAAASRGEMLVRPSAAAAAAAAAAGEDESKDAGAAAAPSCKAPPTGVSVGVVEGVVDVGGQNHFYMECQSAYALPAEGGGLRVWCATQGPDVAQKVVARATGLQLSEVNLMNRRVGGGFGGKLTRQLVVVAAAGAAAFAFRRPVRVCLDRNTDLAMTGGRHELVATFKAAFAVGASGLAAAGAGTAVAGMTSAAVGDAPPPAWASAAPLDVKVLALSVDMELDGGCTADLSFFVNYAIAQALEQSYFVPHMAVRAKAFRTATATRTAMRGPGEIQASIIMESVLERVAAASAAAAVAAGQLEAAAGGSPEKAALAPFSTMAHVQRVRDLNLFPAPLPKAAKAAQAAAAAAAASDQDPDDTTIDEDGDGEDGSGAAGPAEEKVCDISGDALTHYTMHELWPALKAQARLDERIAAAGAYNAGSRWRKRGVAMTPVKYKVSVGYMGALVNVYSDGSVVLSHGGSEMGQGIVTKATQVAAAALGRGLLGAPLPMAAVATADSSSHVMPNSPMTGGSTGSESVCEAVRRACVTLVARMAPVAQKLRVGNAAALTKKRNAASAAKAADKQSGLCPGASQGDPSAAVEGGAAADAAMAAAAAAAAADVGVSPDDPEAQPSWEDVCAAAANSGAECHLQASSGYFGTDAPGGEKLKCESWWRCHAAALSALPLCRRCRCCCCCCCCCCCRRRCCCCCCCCCSPVPATCPSPAPADRPQRLLLLTHPPLPSFTDHNWGAAVSEVEVDVLTGETACLRTDILYDCGNSLNPAIDLGQAEGAFVTGLGFILREEVRRDADGQLLTDGTWTYKPPLASDIPHVLNVGLLHDARFEKGILSSKASGEPPLVLATSVLCAVRHAVAAARGDAAFDLPTPCTVDVIQGACAQSYADLASA